MNNECVKQIPRKALKKICEPTETNVPPVAYAYQCDMCGNLFVIPEILVSGRWEVLSGFLFICGECGTYYQEQIGERVALVEDETQREKACEKARQWDKERECAREKDNEKEDRTESQVQGESTRSPVPDV